MWRKGRKEEGERKTTVYAKQNTPSIQIWTKRTTSLKSLNANLIKIWISRLEDLWYRDCTCLIHHICPTPRTCKCSLLSNEHVSVHAFGFMFMLFLLPKTFSLMLSTWLDPSYPSKCSLNAPPHPQSWRTIFLVCLLCIPWYVNYPSLKFKTHPNYNSTHYRYLCICLTLCCHKSRSSRKQQNFLILEIPSTMHSFWHIWGKHRLISFFILCISSQRILKNINTFVVEFISDTTFQKNLC